MTLGVGTSLVIVAAARSPRPAVREELHHLPDDDGADLRDCGAGAQYPDRRHRASSRSAKVRSMRLAPTPSAVLMEHANMNYAADAADCGAGVVRRRLPVGKPALRLSGIYLALATFALVYRHAAALEAAFHRALDRRRAGPRRHQARSARHPGERAEAGRPQDLAGHVAVLLHAGDHARGSMSPRSTCCARVRAGP